ncbi:hypothetical protein GQ457_18G016540 [Hibiscus cannabinus]
MEFNTSSVAYFDYVDCAHFSTFEVCRMVEMLEDAVEVEDEDEEVEVEVEDEVDEEIEDEEEENIEEFEVSGDGFGFYDEGLQDENIEIGIRVQRQMDGFGPEGVRVNPELESDIDKSDELNSDHDSDCPRYSDFNVETDMINPKFVKGLIFSDRNVLKEAIKHYERVNRNLLLGVSRVPCTKARELAIEMIEGNYKGQYARIYEYLLELRTTNLGTTTIYHLDNRLFQRLYVCLEACKNGFKAGCRRIIYVDGCYLKGYFQVSLLAAVGIDANNQIYPITYATVESENYSSWSWFLDILKTDLGINDSWKALKDGVWKAARATYVREFEEAMEQLKALSVPAYNWLQKLNPAQWSRSYFDTRTKCDMLLNNICESFNKSQPFKSPIEVLKVIPQQWVQVTNMELILPPTIRRPSGRPTKKRKMEVDEVAKPKLCKKGQQANYTKCGKTGHNKRTCRGKVGANHPIRRPPPSSRQQQPERHPSSSQDQQPRRHHSSSLSLPIVVRWMRNASSSQQSSVSNPPNQESQASTRE